MVNRIKLEKLSRYDGSVVRTRDGELTLEIDGRFVHSRYSPEKEAERLVEEVSALDRDRTLVVILGAGLGYHIEKLEQLGFKNMIVIERDKRAFDIFRHVYEFGVVPGIITPDDPVERLDSYFNTLQIEQFRSIKTLVLRGGYRKDLYGPFEERIERIMKVRLGDFATRLKFEENWFINILRNTRNFAKSSTVASAAGMMPSAPVVIVSAGPSLIESLPLLKKIAGHAILIAVDTALLVLYEAGIVPDIVYSLDSQVHNLSDFLMMPKDYLKRIALVYDLVANSALAEYYPGPVFTANTAHMDYDMDGIPFLHKNELVNWMERRSGIVFGDIETGGSVATSAFHYAYLSGGSPIVMTGQDLAYSDNCSHCVSTPHFYRILAMSRRMKTVQSIFIGVMRSRDVFHVPGLHGNVYTDFILNNYKGWFEESAKSIHRARPEFPLLNATAKGAVLNGFRGVSGDELAKFITAGNKLGKPLFSGAGNLIEPQRTGKILAGFNELLNFIRKLGIDNEMFARIKASDFAFVNRYFMREKVIFERYGNLEGYHLERKSYRLIKNLEGITADAAG
ncbi:MAG: hypothetical protein A2Y33_03010 [Spirochaetes bacterium GWF1_51_8]|nr:MAG: hypothetical protein A2Y33_03010 [Spirochaetes bacterium GWF1_51_8]